MTGLPKVDRAVPLAAVMRGRFVESVHLGHAAAVAADGTVVVAAGDPTLTMLPRSALKPVQSVAMLRAGLRLDGELLALASASHAGEPGHLDGALRILATGGLGAEALRNTPDLPLDRAAEAAWRSAGRRPEPLAQNCSGKHAAMVATCVAAGWDVAGYLDPAHPLQLAIRDTVAEFTGVPIEHVAVDGCGAPLFSSTLLGLARAYARLATAPPDTPEGRVAAAMRAHPWWVGGTHRDATILATASPGMIAKDGAEGVFAAALPDGRVAVLAALDGSPRPARPVTAALFRALGHDNPEIVAASRVPVLGHGEPVGEVAPLPSFLNV